MTVTFNVTFDDARRLQADIEEEMRQHLNVLHSFPKGPMGLTPDYVKANPVWRDAKQGVEAAFQRYRNFNKWLLKTYRKEIAAERKAKREGWRA
jgi:hypothetical protein